MKGGCVASGSDIKHKDQKKEIEKERRGFLKKAVYSAPGLIMLGQMVKPTETYAESNIPDPFGVSGSSRSTRPEREKR